MVAGEVLSRDDFRQVLLDLGTSPENMEQWVRLPSIISLDRVI
jgi:hypothetical protein